MGQKVSPVGLRVGVNRNWNSRWYANDKDFASLLHEDIKIREFLYAKLKGAYVANIEIERSVIVTVCKKSDREIEVDSLV